MKKGIMLLCTTMIAIGSVKTTLANDIDTFAAEGSCTAYNFSVKSNSSKEYDIFSDHVMNIKNESGDTRTYHIIYENELDNISSGSRHEYDVTVENGKKYNHSMRINSKYRFPYTENYTFTGRTKVIVNGQQKQNIQCHGMVSAF